MGSNEAWALDGAVLEYARAQLPAFLMDRRWYPSKDAGIPALELDSIMPLDLRGVCAALSVWRVQPRNRAQYRLAVPLALVAAHEAPEDAVIGRLADRDAVLVDGCAVDAVVRGLVRLMAGAEPCPSGVIARGSDELLTMERWSSDDWPIRRSTAQQSNTSIRVGEHAILKLLRKLEQGVHPELEMSRFLTQTAHFAATPVLLGWIDAGDTTLVVLQGFVANRGDGWSWLLDQLRGDEPQPGITWIRGLGARTAEMHCALAAEHSDSAFCPEPISAADCEAWKTSTLARAAQVRAALREGVANLDEAASEWARLFEHEIEGLDRTLSRLLPTEALLKTRHHGDFHLGQVLVQGEDAIIVDFEGEPLRPLAERRAKHSPLRDVAGMLRSFAYVAAVAERDATGGARAARYSDWLTAASDNFLDSYFTNAGADVARQRAAALRLVQFFALDKALYEVCYEMSNRPAWVGIPLKGVVDMLSAADPVNRLHEQH